MSAIDTAPATHANEQASIPVQALEHSREYASRYGIRPDLIGLFPAFSLDDPSQLPSSFGAASWQSLTDQPTIQDWFPSSIDYHSVISILVRPCPAASGSTIPLTLLAHFAPADGSRKSSTASSPALGSPRAARRAPRVVTIAPTSSVDELKSAVLEADGRKPAKLEKVVLWKVEMSENEMIVIEERGGLKCGQMPWPYPPTAEVPTKLDDDTVGSYWTQSNPRMVSLSVWLSPSALAATACAREEVPAFTYPMNFANIVRRASTSNSLPERSPPAPPSPPQVVITPAPAPVVDHDTITMPSRPRRCRPNTAPASIDGKAAFGFGSSSKRDKSPLARPPLHVDTTVQNQGMQGLGIASPVESPLEVDMGNLQLQYEIGHETRQEGKIVWYASESRRPNMKRHDTMSSIRSFANNRTLRVQEMA